jgi:tight adherence protein B
MLSGFLVGPAAIVPSGLGVGEFVRRLVLARRQRAADVLRSEVARWCAAVASELRIGRTPGAAIDAATEEIDAASSVVFAPIAAVAAMSGDVSASLRSAADRPGASALRHVAACWAVAGDAGAGLAAALQRLAAALQATQRLRGEVTAQLAGARASARLLAMLPLFGLLLGHAIGAQPMHFLLHTTAGAVCAALTVVLDVIGLAWTDHIAARVAVP